MEHAPTWLSNSLIYLAAAVIAVPLARALGLGAILGYLLAGIAIGPFGIGLVSNVQDILHFAEFGVVLMLFLVGLELEPSRLWRLRGPIFGWGSAQVLGCAAAIFLPALAFGVAWQVALVAALGLSLSSTAIALQVMAERQMLPTSAGQANFSVLLFQDVAAIPMLALIPLLGVGAVAAQAGGAEGSGWLWDFAKVMGVIAGIVLGGRLLVRPALRWIARSRTPEVFTAAALLIVVSIAMLMQSVGLSMALGAFLGGVLLAESEYKHELEADIEPFKGLLLGLFFIAVGMSIDFAVLLASPLLVAGIVIGFLVVKAAVIYFLAKKMGVGFQDRPVFTLLLAQGGEFAFVVFQAAAGAKVLAAQTSSLLIGAVAISMLLSPLILVAIDKLLLPRFANCNTEKPDEISEQQDAPVIVAGFGRYGQIVSRVMMAQQIRVTVLDHDADRIETARRFGYRVFYGDAQRADLLRLAGAAEAKVLVVAVDSAEAANAIVDLARASYPHLKLQVRVKDLTHAYDMLDRGISGFERELFESSMVTSHKVLNALGFEPEHAHRVTQSFRDHNLSQMQASHAVRHDTNQLIAMAKQSRADLEAQMQSDREALAKHQHAAHQAKAHADAVVDAFNLPKTSA